ncbi:hypothetical protein [Corallococcus terminator]|uniref:Uncharacterized protein n=1 Tax=Corallococcus terminator TaxID=2316733 RepID=A0A3A8J611_9BACT|nr:hypothetical protein [Corallococcus terminator]RKG91132.1 hypothetical protein D7V88_10005 [Corallococcus terminator]
MPVLKMNTASSLFDPKAPTGPVLEGISGRAKTVKPLTERAYAQIEQGLKSQLGRKSARQAFFQAQSGTVPAVEPKLGFLLERAKIPRVLAQKMADLTEGYHKQMLALIEATDTVNDEDTELMAPEIQGHFEKSRVTAERFQEAMEGIEDVYTQLRAESSQVVLEALKAINVLSTDSPTKLQLAAMLFQKYGIEYSFDTQFNGTLNFTKLTPRQTLLPLMKGANVYDNKQKTFEYLLSHQTKVNNSSERPNQATTPDGTLIEMLHQVQPKHETSVFSDHAGFIARLSRPSKDSPSLYVYYHSLEHGHQHTNTRTAWNFGSQPSLNVFLQGAGAFNPEQAKTLAVHDPRSAYVDNLRNGLIDKLIKITHAEQANLLLIVGECTLSIHEQLLDLVLQFEMPGGQRQRFPLSKTHVHGTPTQAPGFDLKVINASKADDTKGKGKSSDGLGVHAFMGYLFLNTQVPKPGFDLEPCLLTLTDGTRQNMLSLTYGPKDERHAFAHLLNKKENDLANELSKCGYVSVGGDLNNITVGTDLVESLSNTGTNISMGSNSTANVIYDKITMLP